MTSSSSNTESSVKEDVEIKTPTFYKLIIHNDETTPIDLVMYILCNVCSKSESEAMSIATDAHESGSSVVGIYVKKKAETMKENGMSLAAQYGFSDFTITVEETD